MLSGGALTHAISSSSTWRELQQLLLAHQQHLGPVHVAAALSRLAKIAALPGQQHCTQAHQRQQQWQLWPAQQQQQAQKQEAAAVQGFIAGVLLPLLRATAGGMNARALANSSWALAKLGYVCDRRDMVQVGGLGGRWVALTGGLVWRGGGLQ